ncbi:MAG: HlyD family secretion protein [Rhodospirillaceae bacterium]
MPDTTDVDPRPDTASASAMETVKALEDANRVRARKRRIAIAALIGIVGSILGGIEIHDRVKNIHEVDARIGGDLITISSRVAGFVTAIGVSEGDDIHPGKVLVNIDARESELRVKELEAQIEGLRAEKDRTLAEKSLVDKETSSKMKSERARVQSAQVTVSSLQPQLDLTRREHERAKSLYAKRVVSRRQLDQAETELKKIEREHRIAIADLNAAEAKLAEVEAERERLLVLDSAVKVYSHREAELQAKLSEQRLDLADRTIKSAIQGVVDKKFVDVGEYVTPGQRLVLIHNPDVIWIDANIKETDIRKIEVGDEVQVSVDAYPNKNFKGKVQIIGNSTTAEFALLPSPNPSGNFTKITQRLPVRIAVAQVERLLRPGMMVEIKINVDQ